MLWFRSGNDPAGCFPRSANLSMTVKEAHGRVEYIVHVPGLIEWPNMIQKNRNSSGNFFRSLPTTACDILDAPVIERLMASLFSFDFWKEKHVTIPSNGHMSGDRYKIRAQYNGGKIEIAQLYDLIDDIIDSFWRKHYHVLVVA